jgi:hypothetical protein
MLSHLKQWILDGVGKRPTRRRGGLPRFRGQIEQLESRTVLSATIGVVAVDVVAVDFEAHTVTVIAVLESRPLVPHLATNAFNQFGDAPRETVPPFGSHSYFGDPWRPLGFGGRPDRQFPLGLSDGGGANGGGAIVDIGTGQAGPNNSTDYGQPQFAHADSPAEPGAATGATSNFVPPSGDVRGPVAFMDHSLRDATGSVAGYSSSPSTLTSTSEPASTRNRFSLNTYDAAFGEYSPNSLLLAADVDSQHGTDLDDELADKLDSDEESSNDLSGSKESLAAADVAASLDALQRERSAIDAVLAGLHEVKLRTDTQSPETPAVHQSSGAITESDSREHRANERVIPAKPVDQADGGMVLLEPSGDANSSAYDLTAVYLRGLNGNRAVPLGVEASIGMYQAIDIGTSELRPTSRENLPIAQPAAAVRSDVSAENAPAKKSEQPS